MILWNYIDKYRTTISAMGDFDNMKRIIDTTPNDVKSDKTKTNDEILLQNSLEIPITPTITANIKIVKSTENIDFVKKRYESAMEYMEWFLPAWSSLKEQDRKILREFYMNKNKKSGASIRLQLELSYSERQVDRLRSEALDTLSTLLLGM